MVTTRDGYLAAEKTAGGRGMSRSSSDMSMSSDHGDFDPTPTNHEPFDSTAIDVDGDAGGDGKVEGDAEAQKRAADGPEAGPDEEEGGASTASAVFNIASSALGAGALALPYAFGRLGIVPALVVLVGSAAMCAYTIFVLIKLTELLGVPSYEGLGRRTFGVWGKRVVAVSVIALSWGLATVYIVISGQLLKPVLELAAENSGYPAMPWGRRLAVFLVWLVVMLPFTLQKRIDALKFISTGAVFSVAIVILALILRAADTPSEAVKTNAVAFGIPRIEVVQGLNNIKVAFSGQTVSFAVYNELKQKTVPNMVRVTNIAMAVCCIVYAAVALPGLLAFGENVSENVLEDFEDPLGAWYSVVAYLSMFVVIVVSFPIVMFPTRDAVLALMGYASVYVTPTKVRLLVSLSLAVSSLIIGTFITDLNLFFGIIGGLAGNLISNIFPAAFALKSGTWTTEKVGRWHRAAIFVPLVYGVTLGPLGLAVSIYLTFRPSEDGTPAAPVGGVPANVSAANLTAAAAAAFVGAAPHA